MTSHALRIAAVSQDDRQIAAIDDRHDLLAMDAAGNTSIKAGLQWYFTMALDATGQRLWLTSPDAQKLVGLTSPTETPSFRRTCPREPRPSCCCRMPSGS